MMETTDSRCWYRDFMARHSLGIPIQMMVDFLMAYISHNCSSIDLQNYQCLPLIKRAQVQQRANDSNACADQPVIRSLHNIPSPTEIAIFHSTVLIYRFTHTLGSMIVSNMNRVHKIMMTKSTVAYMCHKSSIIPTLQWLK